jgi:hypothetical protein
MKRVLSVSLGSSQRNKSAETAFAGVPFRIDRVGTDGNVEKAAQLIADHDGKVDAIGLGAVDRYLVIPGGRRYELRDAARMARAATKTPVVDGGGIKRILEPLIIKRLAAEGKLQLAGKRVLLMSSVDRPGMAQVFPALGAKMVYGDLLYAVGVPLPMRHLWQIVLLGTLCLPLLRHLPMSYLYPTGSQQETTHTKHSRYFDEADIIAGDFNYIKRYMPEDMHGKVIVTNTTRSADVEELRKRGVALLITTTPSIGGESFGTNIMEGVFVALSGKHPDDLTQEDYLHLAEEIEWKPGVTDL